MSDKILEALKSEVGKDIVVLLDAMIEKTPTSKDDEALSLTIDHVAAINDHLKSMAENSPSDAEIVEAGFNVLERVVDKTKTKWDDRIQTRS